LSNVTLQAIGTPNCTDSELVEALAAGLKSDQENIVYAAAWAAETLWASRCTIEGRPATHRWRST